MGQGRGRKVKIKHGITKESMKEEMTWIILICLGREDIRKGMIIRDGNQLTFVDADNSCPGGQRVPGAVRDHDARLGSSMF